MTLGSKYARKSVLLWGSVGASLGLKLEVFPLSSEDLPYQRFATMCEGKARYDTNCVVREASPVL